MPSGVGWELFLNYLIAKQKFQPDFFLYENNKSAAPAIKAQISKELGVPLWENNAALVSAQNRERFYAFNWTVDQPADRGILLKDILVKDTDEIGYEIKDLTENEMLYMLRTVGSQREGAKPRNHFDFGYQSYDWKDKSACVVANWHKGVPYNVLVERLADGNGIMSPCRVGTIVNHAKNQARHDSKQYRIYHPYAKSCTICGEGGGVGAKTGLYLCPVDEAKGRPVYEVKDNYITVSGERYYINLDDGLYMVRKLMPVECARLQTMPDNYCKAVSATQAYRGLGNGWCAEVIIHILTGALGNLPRDTHIQVLSMYDGIGTGRYCLDKMGFTNVEYISYEIDPYAMKVANDNFADVIQRGDAFQVRNDDWTI